MEISRHHAHHIILVGILLTGLSHIGNVIVLEPNSSTLGELIRVFLRESVVEQSLQRKIERLIALG